MHFYSTQNLLGDREFIDRLLENNRMSVLAIDREARISLIGGRLLELVPFARDECLGKTVDEIFDFDPGFTAYYHRALQGKSGKTIVVNNHAQVEVHFEPIRNEQGEIVGAFGYDFILADQERLLQVHQEREEQLANLLNSALDGILLLDRDYVIQRSNAVVDRMYNDDRSLAGHVCFSRLHRRREMCVNCPVAETYRTKKPATARWFDVTVGKHLVIYAVPLFNPTTGELIGAFEILRDITQIIEYANTIKSQDMLVNDLFASIRDSVFLIDPGFSIIRCNPAFEEIQGRGASVTGKKCYELSGFDKPCPYCEVNRVFKNKETVTFIHQQPDCTDLLPGRWFEHFVHPVISEEGDVIAAVTIIRDITDRRADEQALEQYRNELEALVEERTLELRRSELKMEAILLNSNVPILFTDPAQHITFVNNALLEITGYEEADLLGRDGMMLYAPEVRESRTFETLKNQIYSGQREKYRTETRLLRKDGELINVDLNIATVLDESGEVLAVIAVIVDITKTLQTVEALKLAQTQAEEASVVKSQFLATMSHEIRTPLNGVIGLTDLLLHSDLNTRQRGYAELAQASGNYLLTIINDILDFSKIEAGKLEIVDAPFDLVDLVESVVGILAARAQDSNLELCGLFLTGLPRHVIGDGDRIRQILVNFIGNAVKFTSEGGVKLVVSVESWLDLDEKPCCMVRFEVSDTGIGVPEESVHRLFNSFSQVDATQAKKYGGTGLGLAISKELVQLMGGDIGYKTNEHGGSTFWFNVPLRTEKNDETVEHIFRHGPLEFKDVRVLVVDDNIVLQEVLRHQLNEWGMLVEIVRNKKEALSAWKQAYAGERPYKMAIIDSDLEDSPGIELVEEIATLDVQGKTSLILLTPLSNKFDQQTASIRDVDKTIGKPLVGSVLFNAVLNILTGREIVGKDRSEMRQLLQETWSKAHSLQNILDEFSQEKDVGDIAADDIDDDKPIILIAEDNRVNQIVVSEILNQAGFRFEIVGNGWKAYEAIAAKAFSLVLMDCQMPVMDGFQATDMIRRMERGDGDKAPAHQGHIPIIALTANATDGDESRCLLSGMDDYCSKPIHAEKLIEVIRKWLPKQ